ncbi:PTS system, N-acetylglucosamine-specific IIB component [Bowdeniella nasicola]|uniref:PTS system, N-acetylglucosamine-specific IIB component n=1 Tax=Bowdeniella nasicola TaxID=208480 RepID=A0A1H4CET9_9ACTO|nr:MULTISPECIES: PTS glucose/sucrose transporter subunit IIB [Bowdeniella]SEA58868.1 PTS system, N-acetylglucosamine-specific IIB component [Bowdeniella nasicola]
MSNAAEILAGLGGKDNIEELESCITRLRVQVKDPEAVSEEGLRIDGVYGVVRSGHVVQVVVGPEAEAIAENINGMMAEE